nr:MAG TPA_asm: hypothetical protein [Caudoviricetes sp.]
MRSTDEDKKVSNRSGPSKKLRIPPRPSGERARPQTGIVRCGKSV